MRHSNKKSSRHNDGRSSSNAAVKEGHVRRKHISFSRDGNKVRLVKPPPRSMNHRYWFTETESVVKKGLQFEIEPHINVALDVGCRMQLTTIGSQPSSSTHASFHNNTNNNKNNKKEKETRCYLEICASASPSFPSLPIFPAMPPLVSTNSSNSDNSYNSHNSSNTSNSSSNSESSSWLTLASVAAGRLERVRVVLPAGSYTLRCVGERGVQVFAQAWDLETKLD